MPTYPRALGLCISDPFELVVMKSLFVDLKLPSAVIRNEQVQIQAMLYNFRTDRVKVKPEPSPPLKLSISVFYKGVGVCPLFKGVSQVVALLKSSWGIFSFKMHNNPSRWLLSLLLERNDRKLRHKEVKGLS